MAKPLDWLLLARYALLVALCALIPVPLVDRWVENALRRRLVRHQARRHGLELPVEAVRVLGDAPSGGCLGLLRAVVLWPIKKLLNTVLFVFSVKGIADTLSEVVHRALMLEEAIEAGWLGSEPPERIREAMDRALAHVDTRPLERSLNGALRDGRHHLNRVIWESVRIARARRAHPVTALADAADADALGSGARATSVAMSAALQVSGLVPELIGWFRAEMGHPPVLEPALPGPITPERVLPADAAPEERALPAPVEDAEEVGTG